MFRDRATISSCSRQKAIDASILTTSASHIARTQALIGGAAKKIAATMGCSQVRKPATKTPTIAAEPKVRTRCWFAIALIIASRAETYSARRAWKTRSAIESRCCPSTPPTQRV
jgi:hypothetical protein